MGYLDLHVAPNGNLVIRLTPEGKTYIEDHNLLEKGTNEALYDLFENHMGNGWWLWTGGDEEPYQVLGAMTDSPLVSNDATLNDDGTWEIGRVWWFPDYAVRDEVRELYERGEVVFTNGGGC